MYAQKFEFVFELEPTSLNKRSSPSPTPHRSMLFISYDHPATALVQHWSVGRGEHAFCNHSQNIVRLSRKFFKCMLKNLNLCFWASTHLSEQTILLFPHLPQINVVYKPSSPCHSSCATLIWGKGEHAFCLTIFVNGCRFSRSVATLTSAGQLFS